MLIYNAENIGGSVEGWAYRLYNLRWTKEPPTQEGLYFTMLDEPVIVNVKKDAFTDQLSVIHTGNEQEYSLSDYDFWFGPLPFPEPPK